MEKIKSLGERIKSLGMQVYYGVYNYYLDYKYKIPLNSGICFAYYLIMALIPICTIFGFLASILNIDLTFIEVFLAGFLSDEYASIIVDALAPRGMSWTTIVALVMSFWVVSKGINQLYSITKNLFPPQHERNFLIERAMSIMKTILVFLILVLLIAMLSMFSFLSRMLPFNQIPFFNTLYLFGILFILLFLLYEVIPDVHIHTFDVIQGAAVGGALLTLLIYILQLYYGHSNTSNVYGAFAMIAVILYSFNFVAQVIYFGLYFMFERHMKRMVNDLEKDMAERRKQRELEAKQKELEAQQDEQQSDLETGSA